MNWYIKSKKSGAIKRLDATTEPAAKSIVAEWNRKYDNCYELI